MKRNLFFSMLLALAFTSCKKDKQITTDPVQGSSELDKMRDSLYQYAKEEYLWYDAIPNTFNPQSYSGSSDLTALQSEIDAISQFKKNPTTGQAYEYNAAYPGESKYSYVDGGEAATSIGGTGGDFGFALTYVATNDLRVRYVFPGSSAASQNLVRGYKVTAVDDASVTLTTGTSTDPALVAINKSLSNNSIKLTLQRPDGTSFTTTVSKTTYTINPVIKYKVVTTTSGKKVGYFAFSRFTTLDNAKTKIDEAFNSFAASNIDEIVVDLRYNGGGAVETSEYIANYMVPASKNGSTMFTEYFNDKLQKGDYPFLAKKYSIPAGYFNQANNTYKFAKVGGLNLSRAFFLVTGSTASASELLINNLQPALPQGVQIIGRTTYGKPVGFFGIPLGNKSQYDVYLAEFESQNSAGKADFYQGMVPGSNFAGADVADDVTKDFGDTSEGLFAKALNFIDKGNYATAGLQTLSLQSTSEKNQLRNANIVLDVKQQFSGSVHTKDLKRLQK
ncbi:S41 family peptidase [Mucilaginibacter lacusdianchii]|uniref:S41 family peptidase n=1 Tax=Mucilaginibacter lacusdianchii TaxID=2684211 RepID=UPI00131B675E|nr:S41 family peptidase [Mucilaginibacter sp. JXJ CY 39]